MHFCREICFNTDSLQTLEFTRTCSSGDDSDQFWSVLADDDYCLNGTLQNLTISGEEAWFLGGRMESVVPLTRILSRQGTTLNTLTMRLNELTAEQEQAVRDALAQNPDCQININDDR